MNRSFVLLSSVSLIAMGTGLIREITTAFYFGTSAAADAFSLTLFYVDGVSAVILTGLAGYLMVPVMTRIIGKGQSEEGFRLMETGIVWLGLLGSPLVIIGFLSPETLARGIAPEFSYTQHRLLTDLLRFSIPAIPLIMISGIMSGMLQALASFYVPVHGRAVFNLGISIVIVAGAGMFGIRSGAIGLLSGALAQLLLQAFALWRLGWRPTKPRWWHPAMPDVLAIGVPTFMALLLTNIFMGGAQRFIASGLAEGAFSAVNYAHRTLNLLSGLTMSLATVSLTQLSTQFNSDGLGQETYKVLRGLLESGLFLLVPLSFLMLICCEPLVALLFQRGNYDISSLQLTADCLRWLTLSTIPGALLAVLTRAYSAFWRPWGLTFISLIWAAATVAATALLLPTSQTMAIPAGYTIGMVAGCLASMIGLWRMVGKQFFRWLGEYLLRIALFSAFSLVPALLVKNLIWGSAQGHRTFLINLELMTGTTLTFGMSFLLLCTFCKEAQWILIRKTGYQFFTAIIKKESH